MSQTPITIGGIPIPSHSGAFLAILAVHVAAALTAVVAGLVAMLTPKRPGRHPRFGSTYYWSLGVVSITMATLSGMRWREDYPLFILGTLSFAAATIARQAAPSRTVGRLRVHVVAMGLSYILLLTAFYVDNGKNLPLWRHLPTLTYWLLPVLVGAPLILRVLRRHPLIVAETPSHRTQRST